MAGVLNKPILRLILLHRIINRKRYRRTVWDHPLNWIRPTEGEHIKVDRMHANYPDKFFLYTRMSPLLFDKLLAITTPHIIKKDTNFREAIPVRVRLYITLRYLATGDYIRTIATSFSVGISTVWTILQGCVSALWKTLASKYVRWPTGGSWHQIVDGFNSLRNFPNCLGAIDGKHVTIQCPPNTGSLYLFIRTLVEMVNQVMEAYSRILSWGSFSKKGQFIFHQVKSNSSTTVPCCFVAEAFPMSPNMMRPYAKKGLNTKRRIFNYRLSRARRTIENTFGIMASRFRVFRRVLPTQPPTAQKSYSQQLHSIIF